MFDSLRGDVEGLLADLYQAYESLLRIAQEGLSRPAPELQEQALSLGQQLLAIKIQAACLGQQQQLQQHCGAFDAAFGACQALSSAAGQQLQQMCKSVAQLLTDTQRLQKEQGGALGVYTIVHSLDGKVNAASDKYMLAKCWAHYPTPESLASSAAIPMDGDRGGYLLVPIPLKPAHQLRAAIDTTSSSTVLELQRSLACPGGSRCSKVVKCFLGGESVQCHALHGPFFEPPLCELCHPDPYLNPATCVDHVCTSTFHGSYQPVDLRGDDHQLRLHEFQIASGEGSGIYTSPTCYRCYPIDATQKFIFARIADGKNRRRVPLPWSPGQADCVFGAWCPYPVTCPFHHGRLDKPQEPLQPLQRQCRKCGECSEAMQRQQHLVELQEKLNDVVQSYYSKGMQLDSYEGDEEQLWQWQWQIGQVQFDLDKQLGQNKQQLDHFCTCRNYVCFKASSKPEDLECAGGTQMVQVSPPSETVVGKVPALYAQGTPAAPKSLDRFVAAVQHVVLPDFCSSYYTVVPLRVSRGKSEDKCASGSSCPDGLACPKDHSTPGMHLCTDQRGVTTSAADVLKASVGAGKPPHEAQPKATTGGGGARASSSTQASGVGVSSSKGAPTRAGVPPHGGQPAAAPMATADTSSCGAGPSTGTTQPAGTTPSAAGERAKASASAAKGKKGKKKGKNEKTVTLPMLRGK